MPLDKLEIEIPLGVGMATKPSEELQQPDTMRLLQNLHWREFGGLEKVAATDAEAAMSEPSGGDYDDSAALAHYGLVQRGDALSVITQNYGLASVYNGAGAYKFAQGLNGNDAPNIKYAPVNYEVSRRFVERAQTSKAQGGVVRAASALHETSGVL